MPYADPNKQKQSQHKSYQNNKQTIKDRNNARRQERKLWYKNFLSKHKCVACNESSIECLDLHHLDPNNKYDGVAKMVNDFRSLSSIIREIEKCVILCANCHRKYHAGTLSFIINESHCVKY